MGLKAPGILTFIISLVLAVTVIIVHFFGADIALLKNSATHFYAMVLAYLILLFGCIMRGM